MATVGSSSQSLISVLRDHHIDIEKTTTGWALLPRFIGSQPMTNAKIVIAFGQAILASSSLAAWHQIARNAMDSARVFKDWLDIPEAFIFACSALQSVTEAVNNGWNKFSSYNVCDITSSTLISIGEAAKAKATLIHAGVIKGSVQSIAHYQLHSDLIEGVAAVFGAFKFNADYQNGLDEMAKMEKGDRVSLNKKEYVKCSANVAWYELMKCVSYAALGAITVVALLGSMLITSLAPALVLPVIIATAVKATVYVLELTVIGCTIMKFRWQEAGNKVNTTMSPGLNDVLKRLPPDREMTPLAQG